MYTDVSADYACQNYTLYANVSNYVVSTTKLVQSLKYVLCKMLLFQYINIIVLNNIYQYIALQRETLLVHTENRMLHYHCSWHLHMLQIVYIVKRDFINC